MSEIEALGKLDVQAKGEPAWLEEQRKASMELFRRLPLENSELFKKYVNTDGIRWDDFEIRQKSAQFPGELSFLLTGDATYIQPADQTLNGAALGKGIVFTGISSAIKNHGELCRKYLLSAEQEKLSALNTSLFSSGYFLYVPDNTDAGVPLRVLSAISEGGEALFCRNLIVVGRNSSVKLTEESYSVPAGKQSLFSSVTSINLEEGATANVAFMQNFSDNIVSFTGRRAVLGKDAALRSSAGFFGGFSTLSKHDSVMKTGASSEDYEMIFGSASQKFDITSNIIHRGTNTNGKVVVKGVFDGASSGTLKGMIDIDRNARNSNAYLSEHSMLLSSEAKADAIPGLEILNNEVKATHSASVAQVNEEELFYLMARGLKREAARKLIVLGFFDPLLRHVPSHNARLALRALLELRWEKQDTEKLREIMQQLSAEEPDKASSKDIFERHYKYR